MKDSIMVSKIPKPSRKARLTAARLAAVQTLYQQALSGTLLAEVKSQFLDHYAGGDLDGDDFIRPDESHWLMVVDGVEQYGWQLDGAIDAAIHAAQPERKVENIEILLRLIFRCGAYELTHSAAEKAIVINDYVNISKAFYQLKESAFVNAVLDKLK